MDSTASRISAHFIVMAAALCVLQIEAGIVRDDKYSTVAFEETTTQGTPDTTWRIEESEATTVPIEISSSAASRDDPATLHPKPASSQESEPVVSDLELEHINSTQQQTAKLLLLSAPRSQDKIKTPEENIEEDIDTDESFTGTTESTSSAELDVTTLGAIDVGEDQDRSQLGGAAAPEIATKENNATQAPCSTQPPVLVDETPKSHEDNVAAAVLVETEAEYVLVDADVEEFGSFTDVDSAEHLQPIVQSVEIVPTTVDDRLIVNYVHSW